MPADWTTDLATDVAVTAIQPGDLRDYPIDSIIDLSPIILVRSLGINPGPKAGLGGVKQTEEIIRIVHIRNHEHCRTTAGLVEQNMCRARYRYVEELGNAMFSDPHSRLALITNGTRTEVTLSSEDAAGAQLVMCQLIGVDYGGGNDDTARVMALNGRVWAVSFDYRVIVQNGGEYI